MSDYNEHSVISLIVRVLPNGGEYDMELPLHTTGADIIDAMLEEGAAPRAQGGNEHEYQLVSKGTNREILANQSLWDLNIQDEDTLLMSPKLVAGSLNI